VPVPLTLIESRAGSLVGPCATGLGRYRQRLHRGLPPCFVGFVGLPKPYHPGGRRNPDWAEARNQTRGRLESRYPRAADSKRTGISGQNGFYERYFDKAGRYHHIFDPTGRRFSHGMRRDRGDDRSEPPLRMPSPKALFMLGLGLGDDSQSPCQRSCGSSPVASGVLRRLHAGLDSL